MVHNGNGREAFEAASYVLASPEEDEEVPADFNPLVIAETSAKGENDDRRHGGHGA